MVDTPDAPDPPSTIRALTSESQIALEWDQVVVTQSPGQTISGYLLYGMQLEKGQWDLAFNGTGLPDST